MRVVIIGAGVAGHRLASRLCDENHDVVVVDHRARPLEEIASELDVQTILGSGISPGVLEEAGVAKAGLVATVTDRDEVNILAAAFAHAAGARYTAARVSNDELTIERHVENLSALGIDLVVNEHDECAREVLSVLNLGGAKEIVRMAGGRIQAVGTDVPPGSPLLAGPLKDFPHPDVLSNVRLIAVMRQERLLMPHGDTEFEVKDTIYCVGRPADVRAFLKVVRPHHITVHKVVIAGGGDVGWRLARHLERTDKQVVVIEENNERAHECSASLEKSMVLAGSALDPTVLDEIGITHNTAIVASTGNDENNIIACLLAKKLGAALGVAVISKPEYVSIINEAGLLDRAVSPYYATMNAFLRFVRGTSILAITLLQGVPGELLEVRVSAGSRWVGKALKTARLPKQAIVAAIVRGEVASIGTGDTVLHEGDQVIVFAPLGAASKLESVFRK
jgi:trk system potassium uptake protein TrkA